MPLEILGRGTSDVDRARFVALGLAAAALWSAWSHVLHKGGPTRLRLLRAVRWAPCVAWAAAHPRRGATTCLVGLATAKGATATDLKLCRRSAPHATRWTQRTCLSTHKKRLARWFVF